MQMACLIYIAVTVEKCLYIYPEALENRTIIILAKFSIRRKIAEKRQGIWSGGIS